MDLARELKKLWNMKVIMIPIVVGALGTVFKGLEKRLVKLETQSKIKSILTMALSRLTRILGTVLKRLVVTQTPVRDHQLTLM